MAKRYLLDFKFGPHQIRLSAKSNNDDATQATLEAHAAAYKEMCRVLGGIVAKLPRDVISMLGGETVEVPEPVEINETEYIAMTEEIEKAQKEYMQKVDNEGKMNNLRDIRGAFKIPTENKDVEKVKRIKKENSQKADLESKQA